ncbi:MAG: amino acid synthesis family protein [Geminicoccaceae bacterium]
MASVDIRSITTIVEEVFHDGGPPAPVPLLRGAACAVVRNPFAGHYEPEIAWMMEELKPLGLDLSRRLIAALGGDPVRIQAYGKGSIVGAAGELEHGALWHVPGGYGMRELLGGAKAIVPSAKKMGGLGARLDVPIHHREAAYVRSHFSAMEVGVPDAPRPDEIVFILVMTTGPRVHERIGGLRADEIKGLDGLR